MNKGDHHRPNPDALLKTQEREAGGGLKVFLGAAPGVGKTYQMLQAAHELRRQGVDVVVGVAETHGRAENARQKLFRVQPRRSKNLSSSELYWYGPCHLSG